MAISKVRYPRRTSDVFNIEVHGHHVYRITDDGILVHNNCGSIALGLRETLAEFAKALDINSYADLYGINEDVIGGVTMIKNRIVKMMKTADDLHINLNGMDNFGEFHDIVDLFEAGQMGPHVPDNITNWEAWTAFSKFRKKTQFYYNGNNVTDTIEDFVF